MNAPQCAECGRFVKIPGYAVHNGQEGYASSFSAVGLCSLHGEVGIAWDWLGDYDPEATS